jgi:hypothetical protein
VGVDIVQKRNRRGVLIDPLSPPFEKGGSRRDFISFLYKSLSISLFQREK